MLAVNARSNHVHVVVYAEESPQKVRDQLKANCTRKLRQQANPLVRSKTWSNGGDCSILPDQAALQSAVAYVVEAQEQQP